MARIAIINDESEVVALIFQFLTHGNHEFFKAIGVSNYVVDSLISFRPEVVVLPLFRTREAIGHEVRDYRRDIRGAVLLETICQRPELDAVPIILFGISTLPEEMPADYRARVHFSDFLLFPEGLQLLNPVISGYVGSAASTPEDFERLKRTLEGLRQHGE
ncbi:MAG: hypothetical protein ACK46X_15775 [Candidatus Sericytochromatia bacterium]